MLEIWIGEELDLCALAVSDCVFYENWEILDYYVYPVEGFVLPGFYYCWEDW